MDELVDTHAHLDDPGLAHDLPGVLERARAAGVVQVIAIATTSASSASVLDIARHHAGVFSSVGIQPNHVAEAVEGDWDRVVALAVRPKVVAVGETGLDRYWDHSPFPLQQRYFAQHLDLAAERKLPVVIHCRECERDIADQLRGREGPIKGVLHSFTGGWEDAQVFLDLGLHISFAGMITFQNKKLDKLREAAARVPLDRLLVETDSPYLSPRPHRGQPNEPCRLPLTAERLAHIRGLSVSELASALTANARRLFALPVDETL
jgi:TatD DNase family protein